MCPGVFAPARFLVAALPGRLLRVCICVCTSRALQLVGEIDCLLQLTPHYARWIRLEVDSRQAGRERAREILRTCLLKLMRLFSAFDMARAAR
jgi:hypothetical protein